MKSRLEDDIILSSINGFIAELKKITIDLLHGELALPMSAMYKEHKLLPNENIAAFMAKRFNVPDEDFFNLIQRLQSGRLEDQRASLQPKK